MTNAHLLDMDAILSVPGFSSSSATWIATARWTVAMPSRLMRSGWRRSTKSMAIQAQRSTGRP